MSDSHSQDSRSASSRGVSAPLGVVALVILLLAGFAVLPRIFKPKDAALVGQVAPDFALDVVANDGALGQTGKITLSELRGKPVLLDFWASWCSACRAETPLVNKIAQRYKDRGLVVVGVDTDEPEPQTFPWNAARGLAYPIVFDGANMASTKYGVQSLPTLVLVSRSGNVLAVRVGVTDDAALDALIKQAL
jgi:cytochrome c biogenesis protein CcmG/thiol:disulfide interchange protein DsbE